MRLRLVCLASAAGLTACSPAVQEPASSGGNEAATATGPADACGAAERQAWVGQPRHTVPAPPSGADWRIHETGDMLTQDMRPDRLNIEISPSTQRVVAVRCG